MHVRTLLLMHARMLSLAFVVRCGVRTAAGACRAAATARAIVYDAYGDPSAVLRVHELPLAAAPGAGEVAVKMIAAPVNPSDLNAVEGRYGPVTARPPGGVTVAGNEGVGVVTAVGAGVQGFDCGALVIPASPGWGTWRTAAVTPATHWLPLDFTVSWRAAATIIVNPSTAFRMLHDFVALKPGDVVVQNAPTSVVGQCVIQMCRDMGVRTINLLRERPAWDDAAAKLRSLGATHVVKDESSVTDALKEIPLRSVLGLNAVGGRSATNVARFLAPGATCVTYGGMSKEPVTVPTSALIFDDVRHVGFWMTRWHKTVPTSERLAMFRAIGAMVADGRLQLEFEDVPFAEFQRAVARSREPHRFAKVLLVMDS